MHTATYLKPVLAAALYVVVRAAVAQPGPLITKKIATPPGPFLLDSLTLVASTLRCTSHPGVVLGFDFKTNRVSVVSGSFSGDSATFSYRTYPFAAYKPMYKVSRSLYDSILTFANYRESEGMPFEKREALFDLPGIQKSGAITRGISLGNNQGGVVSSTLNLQLEGQLSPKIRLTGVISDQKIPFQPEGNTQQIRELDRIYIQLDHQQGQLLAGDVVLKNEPSAFLRYYKNIQGGQLVARWDSTDAGSQTRLAAGVAKGKFASVVVAVKEGVQGPYRLRPPNNPDLSVVILANSERIYFDSKLLTRGFNNDYVIDYNTGEITLNNNRLVTRFTRLRCDFEYAERNYSRTAWMGEHYEKIGFATLALTHYQEQDNASRPISFPLDSAASAILNQAGDNPAAALLPTAQPVTQYQEGQLLYTRRDTVFNGTLVNWYAVANGSETNFYQVSFSEVPAGTGDYVFQENLGNGKAFRYAGPGNGNYMPVRQAVLPNLRSVSRIGLLLEPGAGHKVELEGAWSRFDKNRLSTNNDGDNAGNAQHVLYTWVPVVRRNLVPEVALGYTRLSKTFNPIDRFRPIEFDRDWNAATGDTLAADDHLATLAAGLQRKDRWSIRYEGAYRNKGQNVKGLQQKLKANHRLGPIALAHDGFAMQSERTKDKVEWYRLQSDVSLPAYAIVPGYQFNTDQNRVVLKDKDSTLATQMHYTSHTGYLRTKDSVKQAFALSYTYREDQLPTAGRLENALYSHNLSAKLGLQMGDNHRVDLVSNYRKISYTPIVNLKNEENLAGRLDYAGSFWEGSLRQEFTYTANTSQEQKRNFQFVKINAVGEGTHQWIDYNGNGLQELDEFVEAQRTEDKQYIKIFTPTNELISAYTKLLNYRLNLAAPGAWRSMGGVRGLVGRFSLLASLSDEQKSVSGSVAQRYVPLGAIGREEVVAANRVLRNTLFWNRTQSNMGGEYAFLSSQQKTLLTNGFSLRRVQEHRVLLRRNAGSYVNITATFSWFNRSLASNALAAQNYRIEGFEVGPEISIQPNTMHRISLSGQLLKKENKLGEEQTQLLKIGLDYRLNQQSNRTINTFVRLINIRHEGIDNSPAAYELLEGLRPGQNITWAINLQQKLSQGLQLLVSYEGRKSESIATVHIGKVQASVLF